MAGEWNKVLKVPSGMKPYPKGSFVEVRPYSFEEMRRTGVSDLSEPEKAEFLQKGIKTVGFPKEGLTEDDFVYLAMHRRLLTEDTTKFTVKFPCPECDKEMSKEIDIEDLDFEELSAEKLPIRVTIQGHAMSFTPVTIGFRTKHPDWNYPFEVSLAGTSKFDEMILIVRDAFSRTTPMENKALELVEQKLFHTMKSVHLKCEELIDPKKEDKCPGEADVLVGDDEVVLLPLFLKKPDVESLLSYG